MRQGQQKRMRGRNRGNGGGKGPNNLNRTFESNGPDVKVRGNAAHVAEKYLQLARDAQSAGDPVTAENHYQHAEHYFRLIAAAQEQFRQQNPYYQAPPAPGQNTDEAFDGEEEDGSQPAQGAPYQGQPGQQPQAYGGQQQPNFNNNQQQPNYQPREQQPQPYGGQQPNYQPRPQQHQQPFNNPPQQQPQYQPPQAEASDGERLPSFITGTQQPSGGQGFTQNGHDGGNNQDGQRFPRHRRRRHRGGGSRPEMAGAGGQDFGGDGPEPGNN